MLNRFYDDDDDDDDESENWLASYSDLVTDLMAVFVLLLSFALVTQGSAKATKEQLNQNGDVPTSQVEQSTVEMNDDFIMGSPEIEDDDLDKVYEAIRKRIEEDGYSDSITIEKGKGYITFRFEDNVLFYPDSAKMLESSFDILQYIGDLLLSIDSDTTKIEIGGHTAKVTDNPTGFFAWELSSDRAIAVLKFFVESCSLPQSKMIVSGYSHYQPVSEGETEESRSQNRRVEVKITRGDPGEERGITSLE